MGDGEHLCQVCGVGLEACCFLGEHLLVLEPMAGLDEGRTNGLGTVQAGGFESAECAECLVVESYGDGLGHGINVSRFVIRAKGSWQGTTGTCNTVKSCGMKAGDVRGAEGLSL